MLPTEELLKKAKTIKPVVRKGFSLRFIESEDLTLPNYEKIGKPICKARKLYKICTITTRHPARGYDYFFEPTQAEILRQIPEDIVDVVVAFKTKPARTDLEHILLQPDYVCGKTTLYGLRPNAELPKEVSEQDVVMEGKRFSSKEIDEMTK